MTVEDGSGLIDADSYVSVSYCDTYFSDRLITEWIDITDVPTKEALLIRATDYIEQVYSQAWSGEPLMDTQALSFPRLIDDVDVGVPERLKKACCELALKANSGTLLTDVEQRIVKEKVAVIETTYGEYSDQLTQYTAVYELIKIYLDNPSSNSMKVVRT